MANSLCAFNIYWTSEQVLFPQWLLSSEQDRSSLSGNVSQESDSFLALFVVLSSLIRKWVNLHCCVVNVVIACELQNSKFDRYWDQ